jgi:hypothetical protein
MPRNNKDEEKEIKEIINKIFFDKDYKLELYAKLLDYAVGTAKYNVGEILNILEHLFKIEKMIKEINNKIMVIEKKLTDNK